MFLTNVDRELQFGLGEVADFLKIDRNLPLVFEKADGLSLSERAGNIVIGYREKRDAFRAMSLLPGFLKDKKPIQQTAKFERLCLMADCSRNAVINVEAAKQLIVQLALMGYNSLMLYTEDTYEIPQYPYFGHLRGRYSKAELKELVAYGKALGIELIPCIQTLAHLNALTDWPAFAPIIDIDDILLTEDERTYNLIDKMFASLRECFDSPYIHIGMDEAHHLGRGKYTDRNGPKKKSDIMLQHLDKVMALCEKYDFQPIIWSDMFFRMQFGGQYNVKEGELSPEVTARVPKALSLCYWNYYTNPNQTQTLEHMFACHAKIGNPLWFAGGSWGWYGVTPKNRFSNWVTPTQLDFAEKYGVRNVIATAWGDDGGECAIFAVLPSLLQYAELCYDNAAPETLEKRSLECFGLGYEDFLALDSVGDLGHFNEQDTCPPCYEKMALYNDILLGKLNWDLCRADLSAKYKKDARRLAAVPQNRYGYLFETQQCLAELLDKKYDVPQRTKQAYAAHDLETLKNIAQAEIPEILQALEKFIDAYRKQWYTVNKPFGFEVQEIRLGGLKERLHAIALRLQDYIDGRVSRLEELEQPDLPYSGDENRLTNKLNSWRQSSIATVLSFK